MWLRFLLFFTLLLGVLIGTNFYVLRRAARVLKLEKRGQWALGLLLMTSLLALVGGRVFSVEILSIIGSTVQLGVVISVALLLPLDLGRLAIGWLRRRREPREQETLVPSQVLPRREFLTRSATGAALVVGGGSSLYGSAFGRHDYQIEEVPIPIPGLAPTMDGYAIVQLSDIHFGTFVDEPELAAAVDLVRRARPDAVVLTGDLLDHDARYAPLLGTLVRRLSPLTRDGVFAIPGNHDYYAGIGDVLNALRRADAHVMVNTGRVIGDAGGAFALLGVDDLWASRVVPGRGPDLARAMSTVPRDLPRVLLAHQPEFFAESAPEVALQLSGHTHGGQVQLGINPAEWVLPYGWVAGEYERDGGRLYVNRGFGTAGPPARVGSPPEVTRIVLVAA